MGPSSQLTQVRLGQTDLPVTRYCQGTAFRHLEGNARNPRAERVLRHCLDAGVNFFDSAQEYGWGASEELLGSVLAGRRDSAVICTKVPPTHPPARDGGASGPAGFTREFLTRQLERSLKRMRTDFVDMYLLHSPDERTPAAEICESMDRLIRSGKTRFWGLSNHDAAFVAACCAFSRDAGATPPSVIEDYFTVAGYTLTPDGRSRIRVLEREMFPVVRAEGLGVIAYSPMDAGQLSPGHQPDPGFPLAEMHAALDEAAGELGVSRAQVCVAWVLGHPEVTSVLAGPESTAHVDETIAGAALKLPEDVRGKLDAASEHYGRRLEEAHRSAGGGTG